MYHTIKFNLRTRADIMVPGRKRLEQLVIPKGTRLRAEIRPYIMESAAGPIEVADLYLEDGTAARHVCFASFCFVE